MSLVRNDAPKSGVASAGGSEAEAPIRPANDARQYARAGRARARYVLPPSTGDEKRRKKKGHSQGKELRPKFFPASHGGLGGMGNDRTKSLMPQTRRGSIEVSPKW